MPYNNELANPTGYEPLLESDYIAERLRTFSFKRAYDKDRDPLSKLKILSREELPESSIKVGHLKKAYGIDGSLVKPVGLDVEDEDIAFDLAILKIGAVRQNLPKLRAYKESNNAPTAELMNEIYQSAYLLGVLSGKGVYSAGGDSWREKAREELFQTFKSMRIPKSGTSLLDVFVSLMQEGDMIHRCPRCFDERRIETILSPDDFFGGKAECPSFRSCDEENIYITDPLVDLKKNPSKFQTMMLILERLLLNGLLEKAHERNTLESTMFVVDGPLAIYDLSYRFMNNWLLKHIQGLPTSPLMMGLEKSGSTSMFADSAAVQAALQPGHIAMVTSDAALLLEGKKIGEAHQSQFYYGKKFIYRSRDGRKTFVLMAPPKEGLPYRIEGRKDPMADEWENYPHLDVYCDYIEETTTNRFGLSTPSIDIICEANYEASLPKNLSMKYLNELLRENSSLELNER